MQQNEELSVHRNLKRSVSIGVPNAEALGILLQFTSASFLRSRSTSPSPSGRLDAIIRGVHPDPS